MLCYVVLCWYCPGRATVVVACGGEGGKCKFYDWKRKNEDDCLRSSISSQDVLIVPAYNLKYIYGKQGGSTLCCSWEIRKSS